MIATDSRVGPPGLRLVMNRDELRDRPEAIGPRWRDLPAGGRAIWPTDPTGGGTWIAATREGLVLCLLNLNLEPKPRLPTELVSRGQIIPRVVQARGAVGVVEAVERMGLAEFAPFRLVVAERTDHGVRVWECRWDRRTITSTQHPGLPLCFVSSGLGDSLVYPRLELFEREVGASGSSPEAQDEFHTHTWPGRPEVSVLMTRDDAQTVSITTVEVTGPLTEPGVVMGYRPVSLAPGREGRSVAAFGLKR